MQFSVFGILVGLLMLVNVIEVHSTRAGRKPAPDTLQATPICGAHRKKEIKTVGSSQPAEKDEWPWMAALLRERNDQYCGGVLITDQHILTSSSCVDELEPEEVTVRLGEYDFTETDRGEKDFQVEEIIMHPDYNDTTVMHDIAVLKLKKKIRFTNVISPICLPPEELDVEGKNGYVTGTNATSIESSSVIFETLVPIWNTARCKRFYGKDLHVDTKTMLCERIGTDGKDSCHIGDFGGPLMFKMENEQWTVAGVLDQYSDSCPRAGIFTRVSPYLQWIRTAILFGVCGVHMKKEIKTDDNSQPAEKDEWPWMAALLRERSGQYCGGVLITDQHILTSSNCVDDLEPTEVTVRLGEYDFSEAYLAEKDFEVEEIITHLDYNSTTRTHNIAVLKLKKTI